MTLLLTAMMTVMTPMPVAQVSSDMLTDWTGEVTAAHYMLTTEMMEQWRVIDTLARWTPPEFLPAVKEYLAPPAPNIVAPTHTTGVEQWRGLVEAHFQPGDVAWAMRVMACESNGNPYAENPRSTATGLFQFLRGWWSGAWGYPAFDPFNPEANVKAAAWLFYTDGPHHWVCK